jgi:predicted nucleic acid-binding protein
VTVPGLTLDAGALIAVERGDEHVRAILERAVQKDLEIAVPAGVVAQVWRDGRRQSRLARLLSAHQVRVVDLDEGAARLCGVLLGRADRSDVIDASVVVCARERGHTVVTSDADDLRRIDARLPVVTI